MAHLSATLLWLERDDQAHTVGEPAQLPAHLTSERTAEREERWYASRDQIMLTPIENVRYMDRKPYHVCRGDYRIWRPAPGLPHGRVPHPGGAGRTCRAQPEPELHGAEQRFWLTRMETEQANVRAALRWSMKSCEPEIALEIVTALWRFWSIRGRYSEGRSWLEALLELDERTGLPARPLLRARAFDHTARFAARQCDLERAVALSQASLAICRAAADESGIASSLVTLGGANWQQGDFTRAGPILAESLALRRELGDNAHVASVLNKLGLIARWQGEDDRAESLFVEALELFTGRGDTAGIAHALYGLGEVALDRCDFEGARRLYEESLVLRGDVEDKAGTGFVLKGLALVAHGQRDYPRAAELAEQSVALFRELGATRHVSCSLDTLARIELAQGNRGMLVDSSSYSIPFGPDIIPPTEPQSSTRLSTYPRILGIVKICPQNPLTWPDHPAKVKLLRLIEARIAKRDPEKADHTGASLDGW